MSFWTNLFGGGKPKPAEAPRPAPVAVTPVAAAPEPIRRLVALVRHEMGQPTDELAERLQASESVLKGYIDRVVAAADAFWQSQPPGQARLLTLVAAFKPGAQVRYWVESEPGNLPADVVTGLCHQLAQIPPPLVANGPVMVSIFTTLGDISAPPEAWPLLPREWVMVSRARSLRVPDEVLELVWPD